jgi:hypothetical protein
MQYNRCAILRAHGLQEDRKAINSGQRLVMIGVSFKKAQGFGRVTV